MVQIEIRSRQQGKTAEMQDQLYQEFVVQLDKSIVALKNDSAPIDEALEYLDQAIYSFRALARICPQT